MPMIYKRFTEKAAEEWRQIYKGLQLLEFLIKNGSERVIDDARSHLTLLKMLRQFHFIDPNGKDQGLNVRNRAKELAELLSDVDRIRAERKKARATRNKYTGVEGGGGLSGGFSSGDSSRYGGFGSEEAGYGGYSGGVYGDGGGFGGQTSDFQDSGSRSDSVGGGGSGGRDRFEEYDEYDEGAVAAPGRRHADTSSSSRRKTTERAAAKKPEPPKKKEPEVDLFSFDDPISTSLAAPVSSSNAADDDDFDDFQSAAPSVQTAAPTFSPLSPPTATTTATTHFAAPQPVSAPQAANLSDMVGFSSISPAPSATATPINYSAFSPPAMAQPRQAPAPTAYQGSQPNYFTSVQAPTAQAKPSSGASSAKLPATSSGKSGGDAFGSIWSSASAGIKKTSTPTSGPALGQLAKQKASDGIWGASSTTTATSNPYQGQKPAQGQSLGGGLDDLLG